MKTLAPLLALTLVACADPLPTADLVLSNAVIWTGDDTSPRATTLVVRGDRIAAIGGQEILAGFDLQSAEVIDAAGRFVTPGFIDTHVHFLSASRGLSAVQLRDAATREEFVQRIAQHAATLPAGSWILEGNWDHHQWGGELPMAEWIDAVTPDHPVYVSRLDGHMSLANSAAMRAAGISSQTKDVEGGVISRDSAGHPTGIFKDNAEQLIRAKIPPPSPEENDRALLAGMHHVAAQGVTSVHNMDLAQPEIFDTFRRIRDRQITRFYLAIDLADWQALAEIVAAQGRGDEWLRIGVLKTMVDGSLGSHTAAFHQPYTDTPEDSGLFALSLDELYEQALAADEAGLQLAIHAIGDRAIGELLDVFERVAEANGPRDRRFRMEHAQHPTFADIERFADLGVIASMQPYHAIDDGRWAEKVIGPERIESTYAFRALLDANARLAFGSDWSVAPPTPLEGIYAAVTRRTLDGANDDAGWVPAQRISVEEALRAYTLDAAYAAFEDDLEGSLEVGKLADFVMLEQNLLEIDPVAIKDVRILATYVGGARVFSAEE
ncbi:MAG: amidohydrolase [Acidobacteriota bacterium]